VTTKFLSDFDLHLLSEGTHYRSFEKLGAHVRLNKGTLGTHFAVWAPNARAVSVIGNFNGWDAAACPLATRGAGIWDGFVGGVGAGALYKFAITSNVDDARFVKTDPHAFAVDLHSLSASRIERLSTYDWGDLDWMEQRHARQSLDAPISIYEVHLGSWRRVPEEGNRSLTYRELAGMLADYVQEVGFTHVELMPLAEHAGEWPRDNQPLGFFAPTSRFGSPQDLMFLIDTLHQRGIGVILDWVPSKFDADPQGLARFDGTPLYERSDFRPSGDPSDAVVPFDLGRPRVANFLISNALFWLDKYHIDGLRLGAVSSMLYRGGVPSGGPLSVSPFDGRENLDAIAFLKRFNDRVHGEFPGVLTIAEERTAWPNVTRPTDVGGLGFDLKWDVGWTHDSLHGYFRLDPIERKYVHDTLTFRMVYAFTEHFILPLSHHEVVPGKGSLLTKMPGDDWRKYASLRLLYGYQFALPGKKLMFMGDEFGQWRDWYAGSSLDWHLLDIMPHRGLARWVRDLNTFYRGEPAMHHHDCHPSGFDWVHSDDFEQSVISFLRKGGSSGDLRLVACNFTPVPRYNYRIGVPRWGEWREVLNSDATLYGGSGHGNMGAVGTAPVPSHGYAQSINLVLPPLSVIVLRGPDST
jgi:1,4-alpha-glucan branching enzyme